MLPGKLGRPDRISAVFAVLLLGAVVFGCDYPDMKRNRISILMTPRGDSIRRRIIIERFQTRDDSLRNLRGPRLDVSDAERLLVAYRVRPDTSDGKPYVAERRFATIPDDVGNRAYYRHYTSVLGSSWSYHERIRGMDDPSAYVVDAFALADSQANVTIGWLRSELAKLPDYPRVAAYLDHELHATARSLLVTPLVAGSETFTTQMAWMFLEVEEHPLSVLLWLHEVAEDEPSARRLLSLSRDEIGRRMGLRSRAERTRTLQFLADIESAKVSLQRYLDADSITIPRSNLNYPSTWNEWHLHPYDDFVIELALPAEPTETNGAWDEGAHRLRWHAFQPCLEQMGSVVPLVCHAIWSVPDSALQKRLFGKVAIKADTLVSYNEWYATLDPVAQAEWNRMLLGLRPGHVEDLERFRFKAERKRAPAPGDSVTVSLGDYPRELLGVASRPTATAHPKGGLPPRARRER
jgi:hypothetical protein